MDTSSVTWANLFPATTHSKLPSVAKKLDGDKYADNQDLFAVRLNRGMLDLGIRIGRKVGLAHLTAPAHRSAKSPDFAGELVNPGTGKLFQVAAWFKPISRGNFAGRMYLRVALTPS